jgi:hypothetical protein
MIQSRNEQAIDRLNQPVAPAEALPPIPEGFTMPFYYSSLTNFEVLSG